MCTWECTPSSCKLPSYLARYSYIFIQCHCSWHSSFASSSFLYLPLPPLWCLWFPISFCVSSFFRDKHFPLGFLTLPHCIFVFQFLYLRRYIKIRGFCTGLQAIHPLFGTLIHVQSQIPCYTAGLNPNKSKLPHPLCRDPELWNK